MAGSTCDFTARLFLGSGSAGVHVLFRGGGQEVDIGNTVRTVEYTRSLDGTGEATVTLSTGACCEEGFDPNTIDPLSHELFIDRSDDTRFVKTGFVGPITKIEYTSTTVTISARSLDWWWRRVVVLGGYEHTPMTAMAEVIEKTEAQLALGMVGMPIFRSDDSITGQRTPLRVQAADIVDDLTNAGLHYTVIGRTVIYGEALHSNPATASLATFRPEDFIGGEALELVKSGLNYSSRVTMIDKSTNSGYVTSTDSTPEQYYGIAEDLYTQRSADDGGVSVPSQANQRLLSQSRIKLILPQTQIRLAISAPLVFDELIPGMPVRFAGLIGCVDFEEDLSIGDITFKYGIGEDENISIELAPIVVTNNAA